MQFIADKTLSLNLSMDLQVSLQRVSLFPTLLLCHIPLHLSSLSSSSSSFKIINVHTQQSSMVEAAEHIDPWDNYKNPSSRPQRHLE